MLRLPKQIEVRLINGNAEALAVPNVLIVVRFSIGGQYYYGDLFGLTNYGGVASCSAGDLRSRFEENRRLFPMDYGTPLDDCDHLVEFAILPQEEIHSRLDETSANVMVSRAARDLYRAANNDRVDAAAVHEDLTLADPDSRLIHIPTRLVRRA
jgi:hypothetical protein